MRSRILKTLISVFTVLLITAVYALAAPKKITSVDQLKGGRIGLIIDKTFYSLIDEVIEDPEKKLYHSYTDMLIALKSGSIDAFMCDEPTARAICATDDGVKFLTNTPIETEYVFAFAETKDGDALRAEFNEFLAQAKSDGTLNEIADIWFGTDESKKELSFEEFEGRRTLNFASSAETPPFIYDKNDSLAGYEADILCRFCKKYRYNMNYSAMPFSSILQSFLTSQTDIAADVINITAEREAKLDFSKPDYHGNISIVVRDPDAKQAIITAATVSQGLKNNFVVEDRWKLILSGLNITLFISVLSGIFGTLLGFAFLILLRVRNRLISRLTSAFINIVQGIPMLILLMVLFYIIFVHTPLSPIGVSVVAFSVNFGTGMAAIINTCINAIPAGQTEAATAMGYTHWQMLFKILMPQAAEHFSPMLKNSFMTLVKTTSIVGYIAISDLTKATDVIRSRTYEAFFPLILTAVLYFLISWLLTLIFGMIEVKFDPKRRKDLPKGVIIDGSNDKNTRS